MNPEIGDTSQEGGGGIGAPFSQRAMINIGPSAVSMLVFEAEGEAKTPIEVLEMLEQPLPVAEDIFRDGLLSRGTIERCVRIFNRFRTTLSEYGLRGADKIEVVTTNLLSEADNAELLLDRLQVACGIEARSLDEGDMTRLVYLFVARILKEQPTLNKSRVLAIHVGPGNTRLMLFKKGRIEQYNSFRMGAYRVADAVEKMASGSGNLLGDIKAHVYGSIEQIVGAYADESVDEVLAIGHEIQPVATKLAKNEAPLMTVDHKTLRRLAKKISVSKEKDLANTYEVSVYATRPLLAGIVCNLEVVGKFGLSAVHVPTGRFEERFLTGLAESDFAVKRFVHEVLGSAKALARKYGADEDHGRHVAALAVKLFDELIELTALQPQDRLLLEVAGIVHEVGGFISRRSHHKHSLYIIKNSEIFGLNDEDTTLVALISRYHRHALPKPTHSFVRDLTREGRIRVSKLAALLRIADALDRSHQQQLQVQLARIKKDQLRIQVGNVLNVSVEELAMRAKGDLFEQVFGLEVVLETG